MSETLIYENRQEDLCFEPLRPDYADFDVNIWNSFDWKDILSNLDVSEDQSLYLVVFRSIKKAGADDAKLEAYDELAYQEALESPDLRHYFKGTGLSFCLWNTRESAKQTLHGPAHRAAMELVDEMYEDYQIETWNISPGIEGSGAFFMNIQELSKMANHLKSTNHP